jgi:hypothetical protein
VLIALAPPVRLRQLAGETEQARVSDPALTEKPATTGAARERLIRSPKEPHSTIAKKGFGLVTLRARVSPAGTMT